MFKKTVNGKIVEELNKILRISPRRWINSWVLISFDHTCPFKSNETSILFEASFETRDSATNIKRWGKKK